MSEEVKYAGFWSRLLASVIDTVWMYGIIYGILWSLYGASFYDPESSYTITQFMLEWIVPIVVVMAFWIKLSATPGKMLLNLKIVDADTHGKVSSARLFVRYLAYAISTIPLFLGFFWVAWDKKKQGFHDKISRTVVIKQSKAEG